MQGSLSGTFCLAQAFPPQLILSASGTGMVQYTVVNNSAKPHNLVIQPQAGISQDAPCLLGPKGSPSASCTLSLTFTGSAVPSSGYTSGPLLCEANTDGSPNPNLCYEPSPANVLSVQLVNTLPILSTSTNNLALSVTGLTLNGVSSGQPRIITLTNTGSVAASKLTVVYPNWPQGTSATSDCASTLGVGQSCTITVIPGANATLGLGNKPCTEGVEPIPQVINVLANGGYVSTQIKVSVIGYGCIYQAGYIFSLLETPNPQQSVGGKVIAPNAQGGFVWGSNGGGNSSGNVSYDLIPGVGDQSTPAVGIPAYTSFVTFFNATYIGALLPQETFSNCQGNFDGACNTNNIMAFYNAMITNYNAAGSPPFITSSGPTPYRDYAAGFCGISIDNGYSDWYLPAICELGTNFNNPGCTPDMQNVQTTLPILISDPNAPTPNTSCSVGTGCLSSFYWSSTEQSDNSGNLYAWYHFFDPTGGGGKISKADTENVRCVRALTVN